MDLEAFVPWEKYPELTADRLSVIASVICEARDGAVRRHEPAEGDSPWGLGCVSYDRTFFALKRAAEKYPWLTITQDPAKPLRFAFGIGHVPFRIYQGEPDQTPSKYLSTTYVELHEKQLAWDFGVTVPTDGILRLAVETDSTGRASQISVVELSATRSITGVYAIPIEESITDGVPPVLMQTPSVDLMPPSLEPAPKSQEGKKLKAQNGSDR